MSDCYIHAWHDFVHVTGDRPRNPKPQIWDACFIGTRGQYTDRLTTFREGIATMR